MSGIVTDVAAAGTCRLSVIIVNWNSKAYLEACLSTLLPQLPAESETLVVDNASFDGTEAMLRKRFPAVSYLQSHSNDGFAAANNLAVQGARGEWLLFLNPDTELKPGAIAALLAFGDTHEDAGVIGGTLLNSDGSTQLECAKSFPSLITEWADVGILKSAFPRASIWGMRVLFDEVDSGAVDVISGACQMVRRAQFDRVAGFSEQYFMYSEDVDLCYRMRAIGRSNYLVKSARITHHGGGSSASMTSTFSARMMAESRLKYFRTHRGRTYAVAFQAGTAIAAGSRLCLLLALGPWAAVLGRRRRWLATCRKWWAVLSWACGRGRHAPPATAAHAHRQPAHSPMA